jgi:hypothetical protein
MSPAQKVRRRKCNIVGLAGEQWEFGHRSMRFGLGWGKRQLGRRTPKSACLARRPLQQRNEGTLHRAATLDEGGLEGPSGSEDYRGWEAEREREKVPGRFAEGPRSPGFILPASAVSEQENCGGYKEPQNQSEKPTTFLRRRAEIRSVQWRQPLRPTFRRGTPCAVHGQGSERGRGLRE